MAIQIRGFNSLIKKIDNLKGIVKDSIDDTLDYYAKKAYGEMISNASRRDRTQSELDELGNPFARKYGNQGNARILGGDWTKKPWMIHAQDNDNVVRSIRYKMEKKSGKSQAVFHYRYRSNYVKYVVKGTQVMVGRNVILETLKANKSKIPKSFRKRFWFTLNRKSKRRTGASSGFTPAPYKPGQFR